MGQKLLLGWAVGATAIALVLLGYLLGSRAAPEAQPVAHTRMQHDTAEGAPTTRAVAPFMVPEKFAGLPAEWRSKPQPSGFRGYAVLFDIDRREVIAEQCRHPGYMDASSDTPITPDWEFCAGLLRGTLVSLEADAALVADRTGRQIRIELDLNTEADPPTLSVSFGDHATQLVPGSRNSLLQAMEQSPVMQQQKQRYFEALTAKDEQMRDRAEDEIPRYTLPSGGTDDNRDRQ